MVSCAPYGTTPIFQTGIFLLTALDGCGRLGTSGFCKKLRRRTAKETSSFFNSTSRTYSGCQWSCNLGRYRFAPHAWHLRHSVIVSQSGGKYSSTADTVADDLSSVLELLAHLDVLPVFLGCFGGVVPWPAWQRWQWADDQCVLLLWHPLRSTRVKKGGASLPPLRQSHLFDATLDEAVVVVVLVLPRRRVVTRHLGLEKGIGGPRDVDYLQENRDNAKLLCNGSKKTKPLCRQPGRRGRCIQC